MQSVIAAAVVCAALAVAGFDLGHPHFVSLSRLGKRDVCGDGVTCEESCGHGWVTCSVGIFCYNPTVGQICCIDGLHCPAGHYCTDVGCCPVGTPLSDCEGASRTLSTIARSLPTTTSMIASSSAGTNGTLKTCGEVFGSEWRLCVGRFNQCYNPSNGDQCCSDGSYCSNEYYCNDLGSHSICCPTELMPSECEVRLPPSSTEVEISTSSKSRSTAPSGPSQGSGDIANSNVLSTGAKAGIGIEASVAAVAFMAIVAWLVIRRKRSLHPPKTDTAYVEDRKELDDTQHGSPSQQELDNAANICEVAGLAKPAEVGSTARYELEGDWHGYEVDH